MTSAASQNYDQEATSNSALANEIKTFQDSFMPTVPADTMNTLMSEMANLIATGLAEQALNVGADFPAFDLPDSQGEKKSLGSLLQKGPVVISFYRGAWCPYCNLEINALQRALLQIKAAGANLVAISPQIPDKSADQVIASKLEFDVLSDIANVLAKECGLVFSLPESLRPIYNAWQLDIPGHNGDDSFELPIPATYILNSDGKVQYAYINMNYTERLEPSIIIEQLKLID